MRLLSKLRAGYPGLALAAALFTAACPAGTAGATSRPPAQPGPPAVAIAQRTLAHLLAGRPQADGNPGCQSGVTTESSPASAGYADCPPPGCPPRCYSAASGSTVVSNVVRCEDCFAAFWVGLDGFGSDTVERVGVLAEPSGGPIAFSTGAFTYYTWWDMYPSAPHIVGTTVKPGDSISASVQRQGTSYTLSLIDATTPANSFTITQSCPSCANSSAEWIIQAQPGTPLADFGSWPVTGATAAAGASPAGLGAFPHAQITMVDQSGAVMVQPGSLGSGGTSFASTWITGT